MPAYKDKERNTWYCSFYYTNWKGEKKLKKKRGFTTKKEATSWERNFLETQQSDVNMSFENFWNVYLKDMEVRLRENTIITKKYIVELKILPYFKKKAINDIKPSDIREWQNELINEGYKATYLKTINNQLSAIFNYAQRYYSLSDNPCLKAGTIGKARAEEMQFWTKEEFNKFVKGIEDKIQSKMAFYTLFWTGIRIGELMALTYSDIDFKDSIISINKSYQRIRGRDVITPPKTPRSKRNIKIPLSLKNELYEYINRLYGLMSEDRIFHFTKSFLEHELQRGIRNTGVKKIRLHDLRHSHASLLLEMGTPILEVRDRLGHEKIETTLNTYAHQYENKQEELAERLETIFKEDKG